MIPGVTPPTDAVEMLCERMLAEDPAADTIATINARLDQLRGAAMMLRQMNGLTPELRSRLRETAHLLVCRRQEIIRSSRNHRWDEAA